MPTPETMNFEQILPVIFMILMGISMLAYVILDGYDLGVGALMGYATPDEKDTMIASIGPFWDANETWLVLGVGILLVAFPMAHGVILGELYLPVTLMLFSLIIRGVAFDFRAKVPTDRKHVWNKLFLIGSVGAALSQGYMLGSYITGFHTSPLGIVFSLLTALCLLAGYVLMGSSWLLMKTTGPLQVKAVNWARRSLWLAGVGIAAISAVTPFISPRIFEKWFAFNNFFLLMPIPLATLGLFFIADRTLRRIPLLGSLYDMADRVVGMLGGRLDLGAITYGSVQDYVSGGQVVALGQPGAAQRRSPGHGAIEPAPARGLGRVVNGWGGR